LGELDCDGGYQWFLWDLSQNIRDRGLKGAKKQDVRLTKAQPLVEAFFTWL